MPPSALAGGSSPHTASTSSPRETTRLARVASMPRTASCRGCPAWISCSSRQAVTGPSTPTRSDTTASLPPSCSAQPACLALLLQVLPATGTACSRCLLQVPATQRDQTVIDTEITRLQVPPPENI